MIKLRQKIRSIFGRRNVGRRRRPRIDYCDLWSLDATLAYVISCYLEEFIDSVETCGSTPLDYTTRYGYDDAFGMWKKDLERMLNAFRSYYKESDGEEISEEEKAGIQNGMELFFKRYSDLWF